MTFVVALVMGLGFVPLARLVGNATGLVDRPNDSGLKIHTRAVPLLGGLAVLGALLLAVATLGRWLPATVVISIAVASIVGLVDDLRPLPPWIRIALLGGAGAILAAGPISIRPFDLAGKVLLVVAVIAVANAVNIVDGQDGLAGGVAGISGLALAGVGFFGGRSPATSLGIAMAGSLLAFLVWNRPPARIFLGNAGAYGLGTLLVALAAVVMGRSWKGLLASGLCLGIFAFELTFTTIRRLRSGRGLVGGDRSHSYDLLSRALGSRWRATASFWILGAGFGILGNIVAEVPLALSLTLAAAAGAAITVWGIRLWSRQAHSSVL